MAYENELKAVVDAAQEAGIIIKENYGNVDFELKKDNSFVSEVDRKAEDLIKSRLKQAFAEYGFIGEETGDSSSDSEYVWVVDPLDGTTNYKMKNPFFNVSIALAKDGVPVLGVVYHPIVGDLFTAISGEGATLNGEKIMIGEEPEAHAGIHAYCFGKDKDDLETVGKIYSRLLSEGYKLRQIGAAALELASVGAQRVNSFFMVGVNPWDVAAGQLIASEAGARVTDFDGNPFSIKSSSILVAPEKLHEELKLRLAKIL